MRQLRYFALLAGLLLPAAYSQAQVSIGVRIGPTYGLYNAPPVCEYGFYPDYPFGCAPYGYWGPEWFVDGVFVGAGPWYHFYYTHPGFYRPFYVNRGFGFRGRVDTFRGREFERDRAFREHERERDFNRDRAFRERGREFDRDRAFRERGREFHDDHRFERREGFRDGGAHTFRGGDGHGGEHREHGDGGHGGRR